MKKEKKPVENDWLKVKDVERHPVELSYYQPAGRAWESIPKLSHNPNIGHWKTLTIQCFIKWLSSAKMNVS